MAVSENELRATTAAMTVRDMTAVTPLVRLFLKSKHYMGMRPLKSAECVL